MMNKKFLITVIVAVLIIGIVVLFIIFTKGNSSTVSTTGTLPSITATTTTTTAPVVLPPTASTTGNTLTVGTPSGSVVMNNFYKTATISADQQTAVIQQSPAYIIDYNVADSSFTIGILSMPFNTSRQAAETAFINSLGISEQDACKLKVYEGVPATVSGSGQYVGQTFSLSFCASSSFGQ